MAPITAIGGVGAGLSSVQLKGQFQARVLKTQITAPVDTRTAALRLIQAAFTDGSPGHDLDVRA